MDMTIAGEDATCLEGGRSVAAPAGNAATGLFDDQPWGDHVLYNA